MIIHEVEQGTDEWHQLRAGIPTASEASKLVTSKGEPSKQMPDVAIQCAADLWAGEPLDRWEGNQWTERGHEMEDRARAWYENEWPAREVIQVGFITDDDLTMGCSPDSLVECPSDGAGMLEIKCLKATSHLKVLMFLHRNGKVPADYILQPQMQMEVAEREWCDMVFYHPDLPKLVVRHRPDEKILTNLRLQITSVISERDKIIEVLKESETRPE